MTKVEICQAFREVVSEEFVSIPDESDIIYEFSDTFKSKMEKLLKRVENGKKHIPLSKGQFAISVIIAIIITFSLMMSVGAIREPVLELIYKVYEGFTEIFYEGDTIDKITCIYSFSEIPEGFVETQRISNEANNIVRYENKENGSIIELKQTATEDKSFTLDNEHGHIEKFEIDGNEINIYIGDYGDFYLAFWNIESYAMQLTYSGTASVEEILAMIETI